MTGEELEGYVFEDGEDVREEGERLAASYVNFYFSNGAVVLPAFGGENEESDRRAAQILEKLCPDREIIPVYARDILTGRKYPLYYAADSGRKKTKRTESLKKAGKSPMKRTKVPG